MKTLQCHSKGDRRFSAMYAYIMWEGKWRTIESVYQCSKRFGESGNETRVRPKGLTPTAMQIGAYKLGPEWLSMFYDWLWMRYFEENPDLYEYAKEFDEFVDIFKGSATNCQADTIEKYVRIGREAFIESVQPLAQEIEKMINQKEVN